MISVFKNTTSVEPIYETTIDQFLQDVKNGKWKNSIETLRSITDEEQKKEFKRSLNCVTFSCRIDGKRSAKNARDHSGILQVDIDRVSDIQNVKNVLKADPHVAFYFVSPSGNGVKAGVKIPADFETHKEAFLQFKDHIKLEGFDDSVKDVARLCYVSYDPDIYINENAIEFEVIKKIKLDSVKNIVHVGGSTRAREATAQKTVDTIIRMISGATNGERHNERRSAGMLCGGLISSGYISESELISIVEPYVQQSTTNFNQAMKNFLQAVEKGKETPIKISKAEERERKSLNATKQQFKKITGEEFTEENEIVEVRDIHMKTLGMQSDSYVLFNNRKGTVTTHSTIDKKVLLDHVPYDYWQAIYSEDGNAVVWDRAVSDVMAECGEKGFFNTNVIRGRGVWYEGKSVVVNAGDKLIIDGLTVNHLTHKSNYIYNRSHPLGIRIGVDDLSVFETSKFFELFTLLPLKHHSDKVLFCGWVTSSALAGALSWRPHLWINAPAESGKSWILNNIVLQYLGKLAISIDGQETTEAGIRQTLGADSMAVIHDESEGKGDKGKNSLDSKLMLARMCSSDSESGIVKGGKDGKAVKFTIRSMFLFCSTKVPQLDKADADRFTQIDFTAVKNRKNPKKEFDAIKSFLGLHFSEEYFERLRNTVIKNIPMIKETISVFHEIIAKKGNGVRYADQLSPMFSCSWFLLNKTVPSYEDADIFVTQYEMQDRSEDRTTEEKKCSEIILQLVPQRQDMSIFELLCGAKFSNSKVCKDVLSRVGISITRDGSSVNFENTNHQLKDLLKTTGYSDTYKVDLLRLDGSTSGTVKIGGRAVRGFTVQFEQLVGEVDTTEINFQTPEQEGFFR